jgi:cadherin EGF LAG seven-pass G-type receptor 1
MQVGDLDENEASTTTHAPNSGPTVIFPKYNNYLQRRDKFDVHSQILVPLKLLGIEDLSHGDQTLQSSLTPQRAVLSYAQFKTAGN